jgi:hypothetical protein
MRFEKGLLRKFQHKIVERVAVWGNRYLYKPQILWTRDHSWLDPYREYMNNDPTMKRPQVRKLDRRFMLIELARYVRHLPGSTAECGVARGVGSALICKALEGAYREGDHHYGFDAFSGLAEPVEQDKLASGAKGWAAGELSHDGSLAQELFAKFPQAELRVGWIPETFADLPEQQFRFVHIDVDLYEVTRDCVEFFYPRLVVGGVMLFDDHGMISCPGARKAVEEYFAKTDEQILDLPTGQGLLIKSVAPECQG